MLAVKSYLYALAPLLITSALAFSTASAHAQQLNVNRTDVSQSERAFQYEWRDHKGNAHSLSFVVPKTLFSHSEKPVRTLTGARLNRELVRPLQTFARTELNANIEVRFNPQNHAIEFITNANTDLALLRAQYQQLRADKIAEYYLRQLSIPPNHQGLAPDHARIAQASLALGSIVAEAFAEQHPQTSVRDFIELVGGFVQTIPYQELNDRMSSDGSGFAWPHEVIQFNQGDYDSKSTLMIAILKALLPNLQVALIYIEQHTLLGFVLPPRESDFTLPYSGTELVVFEPTGPALLPVGVPAQSSRMYLENRAVTIIPVQF